MATIQDLQTHAARYVTVGELAEYWGVSRRRVYRHIDEGSLPAMRLGPRCYRVRTSAAAEFERRVSSVELMVATPLPKGLRALPTQIGSRRKA